jgi:hypothetical protein
MKKVITIGAVLVMIILKPVLGVGILSNDISQKEDIDSLINDISLYIEEIVVFQDMNPIHKEISDSVCYIFIKSLNDFIKQKDVVQEEKINLVLNMLYHHGIYECGDNYDCRRSVRRKAQCYMTLANISMDKNKAWLLIGYASEEYRSSGDVILSEDGCKYKVLSFLESDYLGLLFFDLLHELHYNGRIHQLYVDRIQDFLKEDNNEPIPDMVRS